MAAAGAKASPHAVTHQLRPKGKVSLPTEVLSLSELEKLLALPNVSRFPTG